MFKEKKEVLLPIEKDILEWYAKEFNCIRELIFSQIEYIENMDRDFTGQGVFAEFIIDPKINIGNNPFESIKERGFSGLGIASEEFEMEAPVDLFFYPDGRLDYIEFCYGLKERRYPTEYHLGILNEHIIYLDKEY